MTRVECWPAPDWTEVVIPWAWILGSHRHDINALINQLDEQPGGRYHLHGVGDDHDFGFRFENPADATWFRLRIPE